MVRKTAHRLTALVAAVVGCALAGAAAAQTVQDDPRQERSTIQAPPLSPAVQRALNLPYLSDRERCDLRIFHGVWSEADLDSPPRRASAALTLGVWDDPVFDREETPPELRAEAMLLRGDVERAVETLAGVPSIRAKRIRAEALELLGRFDEADAAIQPVVADLLRNRLDDASELVEGVRALAIRARLRGDPASDYNFMMDLLSRAREELDRLHWPALLAEARLLYAKDNSAEARDALLEALSMNPMNAEAWMMLGQIAVDSFNMDGANQIASRLDELARELPDAPELGSAWAAIVTARARLRVSEPDGAAEALDDALSRYPRMRHALALRAAAQAVRYDADGADRLIERFAELSPGSPLALYETGRALSESRQYAQAAGYLERASAMQPNWPPPLIELGLLELQAGRDRRALDALRRVAELDPFQSRARNSLALIGELLTYETVQSEHFIVRFRPGVDRVMAEEMLTPLEEIHAFVAAELEHEPDRKTIIELMPNHRWFAVRITGMPAIHTIAAATGPVIAMEAPKIGPNHSGVYDWMRVVQHEYAHTVTLSRTRNRIPHWFTEAAAVHLEDAPRDYSTCRLLVNALLSGSLFDFDEINIAFVRPRGPNDRSQAYAQGHWMYEFMLERFGVSAPLDLMDLYGEGVRERQAIESALRVTRDEFFREFKVWAREQAAAWGMLPEPSIESLRLDATLKREEARSTLRDELRAFAFDAAAEMSGGATNAAFEPTLLQPTEPLVDAWLDRLGDHPDVLELKIRFMLARSDDEPTMEMAPVLERYAAARPVDPAPHRLLAKLHLASDDPSVRRLAAPHLEYLDAREQRLPVYASELARLYMEERRFGPALAKADRATKIAPFAASHRELAARIALLAGERATARRHLAALVELEPDREIHQRRLEQLDRMTSGVEG